MSITVRDHKMLWGRAANRCAMADCRRVLSVDAEDLSGAALVGDACHIIARRDAGPRGDEAMPRDERDEYGNLILLCKVHHKIVDDLPDQYPPERLRLIKEEHEQWVQHALDGFDVERQRDEEIYALAVDRWVELAHAAEWQVWSESMLSRGQPAIAADVFADLKQLRNWLFARIWPGRYLSLEAALHSFRLVLTDLINVFESHSDRHGDFLETSRFYAIDEWNPELYRRLGQRYDFHVDLVMDLVLELTRAGNYVCDNVRSTLDPRFRMAEGVLLATYGVDMNLRVHTLRAEYRGDERRDIPYPGLEAFKAQRANREHAIGRGTSAEDPEFIAWNQRRP